MKGIVELDNSFLLPKDFNLSEFENLPIYKHVYGNEMNQNPTTLYWTEYQLNKEIYGTISFVRKLYIAYPDIAKYVVEYLGTLFNNINFDYQRVGLLKTRGSVTPHFDESNRQCCINIGIKNSNSAITKVSATKDRDLFEENSYPIQCKDGHTYLLDTSSIHEVVSLDDNKDRFLFTYGFGVEFDRILSCYKGKK
jgi:hypothetical protein